MFDNHLLWWLFLFLGHKFHLGPSRLRETTRGEGERESGKGERESGEGERERGERERGERERGGGAVTTEDRVDKTDSGALRELATDLT